MLLPNPFGVASVTCCCWEALFGPVFVPQTCSGITLCRDKQKRTGGLQWAWEHLLFTWKQWCSDQEVQGHHMAAFPKAFSDNKCLCPAIAPLLQHLGCASRMLFELLNCGHSVNILLVQGAWWVFVTGPVQPHLVGVFPAVLRPCSSRAPLLVLPVPRASVGKEQRVCL